MNNLINNVTHGDCLEIMRQIDSNSIDMILCDLPYGVSSRTKFDNIIPFKPLWEQYIRITKSNAAIVLTATQPFASQLIISNQKMFRYDLIWEKNRKTGFLNAKKMPLRSHEHVLIFYKELPKYNPQKTIGHKPVNSYTKHSSDGTNYGKTKLGISGGGQTDRYPSSILKMKVDNNRIHSTQKPVALFEYLIRTYTNEEAIVLDNCIGSGTTAIACLNSNRKFIGIEISNDHVQTAIARINGYRSKQ